VAGGKAVVPPVLKSCEAFIGIFGGLLQCIATGREAPGAVEAQLHLEGRNRIAITDLIGFGRFPLVEKKERHRQLRRLWKTKPICAKIGL